MNIRNDYGYQARLGLPGTLYDISPNAIDSRQNAETDLGVMKLGIGVMQGDTPGVNVRIPFAGDTIAAFEGLTMGSQTFDMDMDGQLKVRPQQTIGVLRWGRAWARVVPDLFVKYGDPVFLITDGEHAGLFTNEDAAGSLSMRINAMFIGGLGTSNVAPVEIYNQSNQGGTV